MFIFTLQSSQLSVCVFKINRPCDEQPVPCWKYILWNTTVLCRNLAKHWLGSIELQLYYTVKQQEKYTFTPPLSKDVTFICVSQTTTRRHKSSLSVCERSSSETCWISSATCWTAPPHHDWLPQFAACATTARHSQQQPLKKWFVSLFSARCTFAFFSLKFWYLGSSRKVAFKGRQPCNVTFLAA